MHQDNGGSSVSMLDVLIPRERELAIVQAICEALEQSGGKFVLPFCFTNEQGTRTTHHLIFASKNFRGYEIMKEIMAGESSSANQGVASFTYNPADKRYPLLFELSRPLEELEGMLLKDFAGRCLTRKRIYEEHSVGKPFIEKNYRRVLLKLEKEGRIATDPPAEKRKLYRGEPSFSESVVVTFPR
jgi:hypothetical protein